MDFFRENAVLDYFGGTFAGEDETMLLVHGSIAPSLRPASWSAFSASVRTFRSSICRISAWGQQDRGLHPGAGHAQMGAAGLCGLRRLSSHYQICS
jgi:hypothetical protein